MAVALRTRAEVEHDLAFWTHEAERVTCAAEDHALCHREIDALLGEWERLG
jgi:ABC-type uncharacterized transport system ATPase subunit